MRNLLVFIFVYGLPSVLFLVFAFWSGSQKDPVMGLFGFLSFFVLAAVWGAEGYRRVFKGEKR